jgi:hypothetical protein
MLVRATLILIALFVGGSMVFDGIHVLIYGRFLGPEKPGPWSAVVSSIGLNPLRFGVPFLARYPKKGVALFLPKPKRHCVLTLGTHVSFK